MVLRPGVTVTTRAQAPASGLPTDTGTWFAAGTAERGPVGTAVLVRNMTEFEDRFGDRVSFGTLYDPLDVFFREGGTRAYVSRITGAGDAVATRTLMDRAGVPAATLRVDAKDPGDHGNDLTVEVINGTAADTYVLIFRYDGTEVERTPDLANPAAAVTWAEANSDWVTIVNLASATAAPGNNPAVLAATALAGGASDIAGITDTVRVAALDAFDISLGPGQVSIPGATTAAAHSGTTTHAAARNRVAYLDLPDTATIGTLTAAVDALQGTAGVDEAYAAFFAPSVRVPGAVANTTRTVAASAFAAGVTARSDAGSGGSTRAAAGANGIGRYALEPSIAFTGSDNETLNGGHVNAIRSIYGAPRIYGWRTASEDVAWRSLADQRLRVGITAEALVIGEEFMFDTVDGKGHKLAEFAGSLSGMLLDYYTDGALYGDTADEAFAVDAGNAVNTPTTLANGELRAVISLRMSPFAEAVVIEVVKVPITEAI